MVCQGLMGNPTNYDFWPRPGPSPGPGPAPMGPWIEDEGPWAHGPWAHVPCPMCSWAHGPFIWRSLGSLFPWYPHVCIFPFQATK